MKVIIAGSRNIEDYNLIILAVNKSQFVITEVVSGNARGVDKLGEYFAIKEGYKLTTFPANWGKWGKRAGYIRNAGMANYAEALIAVWDKKSKGTKMMIDIAEKKGLKVFIYETS